MMTVDTYTISGWRLPLAASLARRILPAAATAAAAHSHSHCDRHHGESPQRELELELDWRITVKPTTPNDHNAGETSCEENNAPSPSPASTAVCLCPSSSHPASSSPFNICEFQIAIEFVVTHFPFADWHALTSGLVQFGLLSSRTSRCEFQRSKSDLTPPHTGRLEFTQPTIATITLDARLIRVEDGAIIRTSSLTRHSDEAKFIGRDINSWGDVDILLEVPPTQINTPTTNITPTTPNTPSIDNTSSDSYSRSSSDDAACDCSHESTSSPPSAGLYCLNLLPGHSIPLHIHHILDESEMIWSDGVLVQDSPHPARIGDVHSWKRVPHTYSNPTSFTQRILCVDVPMFIPSDEVLIPRSSLPALPHPRSRRMDWSGCLLGATPTNWTFPGGWPQQTVTLTTDQNKFETPHAVVVYAYGQETQDNNTNHLSSPPASGGVVSSLSSPPLLFVHHRVRGWELPGGKVDPGESAVSAVLRECREESGRALIEESIQLIAQYRLEQPNTEAHVKNVYLARIDHTQPNPTTFTHETAAARVMPAPKWSAMLPASIPPPPVPAVAIAAAAAAGAIVSAPPLPSSFSSILRDNVYPLCLQFTADAMRKQG